ncbi:hypothetical protein EDB80DRAFT_723761 [Ilyonectria destructans]|nr:hypothetical protein EDB80DRAFT_723761 [Ilyonectria destructans]
MWPDSIKRIVIIQEHISVLGAGNRDRPEIARLGAIVASHSFKLEELAVCHCIEANDFFEEVHRLQTLQPRPWNNLLSLALTFDRLSRNLRMAWSAEEDTQWYAQQDRRLNSLFQNAGEAAKLTPVLRTMQLLNCNYICNGVFKYKASNGNATVRWACTWPFQLSDRVRQVWGEVAQQNNFGLQILSEGIDSFLPCHSAFYSFSSRD